MGKVNQLFQEAIERKRLERYNEYVALGYSPDDAAEMSFEDQQADERSRKVVEDHG